MIFERTCIICKKAFETKRVKKLTCSKKCSYENHRQRLYRAYHSRTKKMFLKSCSFCGDEYHSFAKNQKFCSTSCCQKYRSRHNYFNGLKRCSTCNEFKSESSFKIQSNGGGRIKVSSRCGDCKKSFDKLRSAKRRSLTVSVNFVDYIKVFDAYQWKCADCGCNTPKELRGKNLPNSPELDHIMPISLCGSHDYHNVQLLCRSCNLKKSNKYAKTGIRTNGLLIQARETDISNYCQTH